MARRRPAATRPVPTEQRRQPPPLPDGYADWQRAHWSQRQTAFMANFEDERDHALLRYQSAARALREGEIVRDEHLIRAEGYNASPATLRKVREEHERDLAEFRQTMREARRHGEWLAQCRLAIWLGEMLNMVMTEKEAV